MFLVRFCNVVAAEIQLTSHQLVEVLQYEYASLHKSIQTRRIKRELKRKMKESNSYAEWRSLAEQYDNFEDVRLWKEIEESDQYDWKYIRYLSRLLTELREKGEYMKLIHVIRSNALKNLGNIQNPSLYWHSFTGTKHLIEAFHKEMITCINYIATLPEHKLSKQKKLEFFSETRHAFGRTALVLSGGASMGQYHYGVTRCLFEEGLIPRVISGSSSGSIFASLLCTKTLEELEAFKDPKNIKIPARFHEKRNEETVWKRLKRLFSKGYYCETEDIKEFVRENVGDVTFQEAYDRTGWILNIVVTGQGEHDGYRLLNYLSAPNVLIWSAVCASCAVPYVFASVDLLCKDEEGKIVSYIPDNFKRFVDGTLTADVPIKDLSEMFNVNHIIVSQVNPMITIFLNHSEFYRNSIVAYVFKLLELIKDMVGSEFRHRVSQMERLGLFPLSISRYFTVLNQQYSGNVTIWAPPTLHDSLHILQHPGTESMTRGGKLGARGVYYKLNHVSSALGIEKALKKAHSMVRQLPDISSEQDLETPKQLTNEVSSKWKEDSLFSSEDETRELPVGRRLSSFLAPRSPLVKVLSGKARSSFKEKRVKQQKKEKDEAKISS